MRFKPRVPAYMTFEPEPDTEFNTLGELFEAPQVKRFMAHPNFVGLHIAIDHDVRYLMMTLKESPYKWCVGMIYD